LNDISVRWTVNTIMSLIEIASQDLLWEINDQVLWRQATTKIEGVVRPMVELRGLTEAYVVINGSTTKPADIDAGIMRGKIFIKPARSIKRIEFDLIITSQGVSFSEVIGTGY
jgi:phage tail sheath protein FI